MHPWDVQMYHRQHNLSMDLHRHYVEYKRKQMYQNHENIIVNSY